MELLGTETLHAGKHVDFVAKRYQRADGSEVEREVVEHPGSVAVLAYDEEFAYLVAQPREAVEEDELLEIPAGTLDVEGESELECAKRELAEEAELEAEHWSLLHVIYPSPGFLSEKVRSSRPPASRPPVASATTTRRSRSSASTWPRSRRRCRRSATPPR